IAALVAGRFFGISQAQPDAQCAYRQIDEEDTSPSPCADQQTSDDRSDGDSDAGAGRPDTDGPGFLSLLGKGVVEQGKRTGDENGRTDTLYDPRCDKKGQGRGNGASQRCERENDEAGRKDPFGANAVTECAGSKDEGGEGQRIGVDHPLQCGHATADRSADRLRS